MTTTTWPYGKDADQHDPLTALRIPVTGRRPAHRYIAAFDRDSQVRPTDAEARMLASYIDEYKDFFFGDSWFRQEIEKLPFDSGHATRVFHKWAPDDWSYRIAVWEKGAFWAPLGPGLRGTHRDLSGLPRMTLMQVLDRANTVIDEPAPHWLAWKATHSAIFPPHVKEN